VEPSHPKCHSKGNNQKRIPSKYYKKSEFQNLHSSSSFTSLNPHPHLEEYETLAGEQKSSLTLPPYFHIPVLPFPHSLPHKKVLLRPKNKIQLTSKNTINSKVK